MIFHQRLGLASLIIGASLLQHTGFIGGLGAVLAFFGFMFLLTE